MVFGAGSVGYFEVMSSFLRGAARVFSIDHLDERLSKTKDLGAEIINFDKDNPVEILHTESKGKGVLCIDAVGFEAVGHTPGSINKGSSSGIHDHSTVSNPVYEPVNPIQVFEWMYQSARKFSTVSVP